MLIWNNYTSSESPYTILVRPRGLEPPARGLGNHCSILTELRAHVYFFLFSYTSPLQHSAFLKHVWKNRGVKPFSMLLPQCMILHLLAGRQSKPSASIVSNFSPHSLPSLNFLLRAPYRHLLPNSFEGKKKWL